MTRTPDPVISPPTRRPAAAPMSSLGPVPPTPAGWVDEDAEPRRRSPSRGLQIDTTNITISSTPESNSNSGSVSSGLARAHAVRGEPKSIRERRSESRTGKHVAIEEPSNNPWADAITPSDIMVPPVTVLGRRPTITKSTPRSGRSFQNAAETPNSARSLGQGTPTLNAPESRGSTPRPLNSAHRLEAPTPPFSPDQFQPGYANGSPMIPPKSLPTPPPQSRMNGHISKPSLNKFYNSATENGTSAYPSPGASTHQRSTSSQMSASENFLRESLQRHKEFAQKESTATTDEERVRLFAEFIVSESRLRRVKYASAIDAMGSEILELTRDLFRPYAPSQRASSNSFSSDRSRPADLLVQRSTTPVLQLDSGSSSRPSSASGDQFSGQTRPELGWGNGNGYMPSLSPIESISQSQIPDESSSRGRPSSRWWEVGQEGSVGSPTKLERSKRESKYMGVPRELRESLQWDSNGESSSALTPRGTAAGSSSQKYGANEYPPEKTGWHEEGPQSAPLRYDPTNGFVLPSPAPMTPNPRHLDVSRLVTLPPPYPRHHPAVNNNHPDLTSIRTSVRSLSDFAEVEATKSRFTAADITLRDSASAAASQRRSSLRTNIQRQIEAGTMTYADAAALEANSAVAEAEAAKAISKTSFEKFQADVIGPLNDLLMDRIHRATALFEELRTALFSDAQRQSPNATQEEGDEQPELLEKLTLLKWIFEAREGLHRELYELLSDRNDRYKDVVTQPYKLAGNAMKAADAERFFAGDAKKRRAESEKDSLTRTLEFMDIVETNVVRGVEVQLSAFWDIAPGLRQITEKIPKRLTRDFNVQIPAEEYEENPNYYSHPLQYLYSLLEHGEKSTFQFIESQINLLCLLHEVKSAVATGNARVDDAEAEAEEVGASNDSGLGASRDLERVRMDREAEERRLTNDLKEKVRCVEELWESALGDEFTSVRERVRGFLEEEGGWEGVEEQV
jgi:hypothetical protein